MVQVGISRMFFEFPNMIEEVYDIQHIASSSSVMERGIPKSVNLGPAPLTTTKATP
jgi:hypothetical protein